MARLAPRNLLFAVIGILVTLVLIFPAYVMFTTSLKPDQDIFLSPPPLFPRRVELESYRTVVVDSSIPRSLLNSVVISVGTGILVTALAFPAAYGISRYRFKGRRTVLLLLLVMQVFAPIVLIIGAFRVIAGLHLANTYWALIFMDSTFALPFGIWLLASYLESVPHEIEEAGLVDGASHLRVLWSITRPLALPGLGLVAGYGFVTAWNEFLFALTFAGSNDLKPISVGIFQFRGEFQTAWGPMMAASTLAVIPPIAVFFYIQRGMVRGLISGALN